MNLSSIPGYVAHQEERRSIKEAGAEAGDALLPTGGGVNMHSQEMEVEVWNTTFISASASSLLSAEKPLASAPAPTVASVASLEHDAAPVENVAADDAQVADEYDSGRNQEDVDSAGLSSYWHQHQSEEVDEGGHHMYSFSPPPLLQPRREASQPLRPIIPASSTTTNKTEVGDFSSSSRSFCSFSGGLASLGGCTDSDFFTRADEQPRSLPPERDPRHSFGSAVELFDDILMPPRSYIHSQPVDHNPDVEDQEDHPLHTPISSGPHVWFLESYTAWSSPQGDAGTKHRRSWGPFYREGDAISAADYLLTKLVRRQTCRLGRGVSRGQRASVVDRVSDAPITSSNCGSTTPTSQAPRATPSATSLPASPETRSDPAATDRTTQGNTPSTGDVLQVDAQVDDIPSGNGSVGRSGAGAVVEQPQLGQSTCTTAADLRANSAANENDASQEATTETRGSSGSSAESQNVPHLDNNDSRSNQRDVDQRAATEHSSSSSSVVEKEEYKRPPTLLTDETEAESMLASYIRRTFQGPGSPSTSLSTSSELFSTYDSTTMNNGGGFPGGPLQQQYYNAYNPPRSFSLGSRAPTPNYPPGWIPPPQVEPQPVPTGSSDDDTSSRTEPQPVPTGSSDDDTPSRRLVSCCSEDLLEIDTRLSPPENGTLIVFPDGNETHFIDIDRVDLVTTHHLVDADEEESLHSRIGHEHDVVYHDGVDGGGDQLQHAHWEGYYHEHEQEQQHVDEEHEDDYHRDYHGYDYFAGEHKYVEEYGNLQETLHSSFGGLEHEISQRSGQHYHYQAARSVPYSFLYDEYPAATSVVTSSTMRHTRKKEVEQRGGAEPQRSRDGAGEGGEQYAAVISSSAHSGKGKSHDSPLSPGYHAYHDQRQGRCSNYPSSRRSSHDPLSHGYQTRYHDHDENSQHLDEQHTSAGGTSCGPWSGTTTDVLGQSFASDHLVGTEHQLRLPPPNIHLRKHLRDVCKGETVSKCVSRWIIFG
ncbi:unnamed protein product [Amoebophrya sp. A25]|nr:unnamed protein product [Amoebophrya sp. A25]|eukprot:GSA25T00019399001.1